MSRVLVALRIKTTPERAFEAFTREIAQWWRPNLLFSFTGQDTRALRFEPGVGGRFLMTLRDGSEFEIGRVQLWEPPSELAVFQLRHAEWWQALLATLAQHATRT
jgi:uncharacterized protein YndB with AHSA1/START domain